MTGNQDQSAGSSPDDSPPSAGQLQKFVASFAPGDVVFREGDGHDRDLYVLLEGAVEISRAGFTINEVRAPSSYLGEMSTLLDLPRTATMVASEPTRMYRIPQEVVRSFCRKKPDLVWDMARGLASRLHEMNEKYRDLVAKLQPAADPIETGTTRLLAIGSLASLAVGEDGMRLADVADPAVTFVNGVRVEGTTPLESGDRVQLGRHLIQVFSEHPDLIDLAPLEAAAAEEALEAVQEAEPAARPRPGPATPGDETRRIYGRDAEMVALVRSIDVEPFPERLSALIDVRLAAHWGIESAENQRRELLKGRLDPPEGVKAEIEHQRRELESLPDLALLRARFLDLQARLADARRKEIGGDRGAGTRTGDEVPDPLLVAAWEIGLEQVRLLIDREATTPEIIEICSRRAAGEPLCAALSRLGRPPGMLFGLAIFGLALEDRAAAETTRQEGLREEIEAASSGSSAGLIPWRRTAGVDRVESLKSEIAGVAQNLRLLERERKWIEALLVPEFWICYELAALGLVEDRLSAAEKPFGRALLRWGLLGCSPRFLPLEHSVRILSECRDPYNECTNRTDETIVVYADEYLELVARGAVTPSVNEDLELNHRHSPLWKADLSWRRMVHSKVMESLYRDAQRDLDRQAAAQNATVRELETRLRGLAGDAEARKTRAEVQGLLQDAKVEAGRIGRIVEKIARDLIPRQQEKRKKAQQVLFETGVSLNKSALVRQEVAGIKRMCRLVARLKEPFLPFALREAFRPEIEGVHFRENVIGELGEAERLDPLLFREPLSSAESKKRIVTLRLSPVVLVLPACGVMGFCWNPRRGSENGRLVLPGYSQRGRMLQDLLWTLLADFRFENAAAAAGVDSMNADTLSAAYSSYRWRVRNQPVEVLDKEGINMKEKPRDNWRRHYKLHMKSADEAGKLLFFKSPGLYDIVLKYIDLPEGVERLRRP